MATKERAGEKLLRFPRRDTVNVSRRAFLGLAEAGVGFLLGAVLAGAELFGLYAPFGVAAVAAAGSGVSGFCTLAGTCLGYLCLEGLTDGMRYAASAILVYAVAFAFFDTKAYRTAWFMPAIASLLCALTGIICRGGDGWHGEDLIYFVTEVLCAGGAALAYRVLFLQWPETLDGLRDLPPKETAGVLVLGGTVLMSLARVELLGTFSLGRLLAAVGIDVGRPPGAVGRDPGGGFRRGGPGPLVGEGPVLQPGLCHGGAGLRLLPEPAENFDGAGLISWPAWRRCFGAGRGWTIWACPSRPGWGRSSSCSCRGKRRQRRRLRRRPPCPRASRLRRLTPAGRPWPAAWTRWLGLSIRFMTA